jgi:hypothetical protein
MYTFPVVKDGGFQAICQRLFANVHTMPERGGMDA